MAEAENALAMNCAATGDGARRRGRPAGCRRRPTPIPVAAELILTAKCAGSRSSQVLNRIRLLGYARRE